MECISCGKPVTDRRVLAVFEGPRVPSTPLVKTLSFNGIVVHALEACFRAAVDEIVRLSCADGRSE